MKFAAGTLLALILAVPLFAAVYGWVENIVLLAHSHEITGLVALRAVGVVIPFLGAVLGYC